MELLKEALDKGARIFEEEANGELIFSCFVASLFHNKALLLEHITKAPPEFLIRVVLHILDNLANVWQQNELIKYVVEKGADLNCKNPQEGFNLTLFEELFTRKKFEMLEFIQNTSQVDYQIGTLAWLVAIGRNYNVNFIVDSLQKFPNGFRTEEATDFMRARGEAILRLTVY